MDNLSQNVEIYKKDVEKDMEKDMKHDEASKVKVTTANLYNLDKVDTHVKIGPEKTIFGLAFYIIIFAILIPIFLIKRGEYELIESYIPNLDLVAGLVSFEGGIFPGYLFMNLYQATPVSLSAFLSQTTINYIALLGVTFIIARETFVTKSIAKGWSIGIVMLLVTYLLPGQFISSSMSKANEIIKDIFNITEPNHIVSYGTSLLIGTILTFGVILLEKFLIKKLRKKLDLVGEFVLNIPKLIK